MQPDDTLHPTLTHPETAWLIQLVPIALTIAAIVLVVFVLRARLMRAIVALYSKRAAAQRRQLPATLVPDGALYGSLPPLAPGQLLTLSTGVALSIVLIMRLIVPTFLALILASPLAALLIWAVGMMVEQRVIAQIDARLTTAVGRLSALLRGGNSYRQALALLLTDMEDGPLTREWQFLLERQGVPLTATDGIATASQVVAALAVQTPSRRHATFLNHLAVAVNQPQDVLIARCVAAYEALQASERRKAEAVTELAQMRYSGMAVGLAGVVMALYLAWTQWERVVIAYRSPLGVVMGILVVASLLLPIVGGALLSRSDDVDY